MAEYAEDREVEETDKGTILIGKKPVMSYAMAIAVQLKDKKDLEVIIKARGKFISKAVDVVELATKRLLKKENLSLKSIEIDTESFEQDQRTIHVSTIEIRLVRD